MNKNLTPKGLAQAATAGCLLLACSSVFATASIIGPGTVKVFSVGDAFDVKYLCASGAACPANDNTNVSGFDVTATSTWTVTSIEGAVIGLDIDLGNTTSDPDSTTNRIVEFGVKVLTPDATAVSANSTSGIWNAVLDTNFPGFQTVDLLVDDPQSGGKSGIFEGITDNIDLSLTLTSFNAIDGLMLEIFPIKFQGVGQSGQSLEFAGVPGIPGTEPAPGVPEPAPLALIALGGILLGWKARKSRT